MNKQEVLNKVLHMLKQQWFHDWYTTGRYDRWLNRIPNAKGKIPIKKKVEEDLIRMLAL